MLKKRLENDEQISFGFYNKREKLNKFILNFKFLKLNNNNNKYFYYHFF